VHALALDVLQKILAAGPHGWRLPDGDLVGSLATLDLARFDLVRVGDRDPWRFYAGDFAQSFLDRMRRERATSPATAALSRSIERHSNRAIRR
jgi:hypothetical protein